MWCDWIQRIWEVMDFSGSIREGEFVDRLRDHRFLHRDWAKWNE
jgi:hypothetical protein